MWNDVVVVGGVSPHGTSGLAGFAMALGELAGKVVGLCLSFRLRRGVCAVNHAGALLDTTG